MPVDQPHVIYSDILIQNMQISFDVPKIQIQRIRRNEPTHNNMFNLKAILWHHVLKRCQI